MSHVPSTNICIVHALSRYTSARMMDIEPSAKLEQVLLADRRVALGEQHKYDHGNE
jgi:hypothetical protein